jgi:hypothetical protein
MGQFDLVLSHSSRGTRSEGGGPQVCRKVVHTCSQPQGIFLHFETRRSGVGECASSPAPPRSPTPPPTSVSPASSRRAGSSRTPLRDPSVHHVAYIAGELGTPISQSRPLLSPTRMRERERERCGRVRWSLSRVNTCAWVQARLRVRADALQWILRSHGALSQKKITLTEYDRNINDLIKK